MKKMDKRKLIYIIVPFILAIVFFSSVFSYMYNLNYFKNEYNKLNVYDRFAEDTAENATKNIMGYFKSNNELDALFFNQDEINHLHDVKGLIEKSYSFYLTAIAVFWVLLIAMYLMDKKNLVKNFANLVYYSGITSAVLLVLFAILYFSAGFDVLFLSFHKLFFTGNYAFDPAVSNMKALFPDRFFFDMSLAILISVLIKTASLIVIGYYFRKRK